MMIIRCWIPSKALLHAMILVLILSSRINENTAFSVAPTSTLSVLTTPVTPSSLSSTAKAPAGRLGSLTKAASKYSTLLFFKDENSKDDDSSSPSAVVKWKNATCIPNNIDFFLKPTLPLFAPSSTRNNSNIEEQRALLKQQLARAAITNFQCQDLTHVTQIQLDKHDIHDPRVIINANDKQRRQMNSNTYQTAESLMKTLESLHPLPIPHPATHPTLNSHWSFVFTGVPTIGMKLITLLSRISSYLPFEILDFREVGLIVTNDQRNAKAVVEVRVCGVWDVVLEVHTSLRRPRENGSDDAYWKEILKKRNVDGDEVSRLDSAVDRDICSDAGAFEAEENGTLLLEHFQGIQLNGIDLPTPKQWHTTRTLEVTYMDDDIMIARTSGGEPHLLIRTSQLCHPVVEYGEKLGNDAIENQNEFENQTEEDDDSCDVDENRWTEFFTEAMEMYGTRITRCLVDREFGKSQTNQQLARRNLRQEFAAQFLTFWNTNVKPKNEDDITMFSRKEKE